MPSSSVEENLLKRKLDYKELDTVVYALFLVLFVAQSNLENFEMKYFQFIVKEQNEAKVFSYCAPDQHEQSFMNNRKNSGCAGECIVLFRSEESALFSLAIKISISLSFRVNQGVTSLIKQKGLFLGEGVPGPK